jgi:hypothetical protein
MLKKRCDGIANGVEFTFRPQVYQNSMCIAQVHVAITLRGCQINVFQMERLRGIFKTKA